MCHGARTGQRVGARHARPPAEAGGPARGCAPAALSRGAVAPLCAPWLSGGVGARSAPTNRRARSPRGVEQGAAFWCARLKNVRVRLAARLLHGHIDLPRAVHIRHLELLLTATWQLSCLPSWPQYCRATPTECLPFLGKPVSSMIQAWIGPCRSIVGSTRARTTPSTAASDQSALATRWCSDWCVAGPGRARPGPPSAQRSCGRPAAAGRRSSAGPGAMRSACPSAAPSAST